MITAVNWRLRRGSTAGQFVRATGMHKAVIDRVAVLGFEVRLALTTPWPTRCSAAVTPKRSAA